MSWMRFTESIATAESPEAAAQRLHEYLTQIGYKRSGEGPALRYGRGSALGSLTSFSPKRWQATVQAEITPGDGGPTTARVDLNVNTTGQMVIARERRFWQEEFDAMLVAAGGAQATVAREPLSLAEASLLREQSEASAKFASGAGWFFWIAGLSLINSIISLTGATWTFFLGLGITQFVDALAAYMVEGAEGNVVLIVKGVGFAIALVIAGLFILVGVLARRRARWAYILGMVLYALDALLFIWFQDYWSVGFHALVLFWLYQGLAALGKVREMEAKLAPQPPAA